MNFIGRKEEINLLRNAYNNDRYEGIVIYGRRRIGKSELIKESYKNLDIVSLYYECVDASEETNAKFLSEKIASTFNIPTPDFTSIRDCLIYIFNQSLDKPVILVLDEYPYLRKNNSALDSILQSLIDEYKSRSQLKFLLCGSFVAVMEDLLSEKNPLYGRFSIKINVRQMDYYESADFYPNFSNEDKLAIYSVFGGVPYYNQFVNDKISVKENIINLIVSTNARLLSEAKDFISLEINKIANTNETFNAIAEGNKKFSDILNKSHVTSSPTLVDVLKKLEEMDAISKVSPINDESKKKTIYEISDRLTLFYYRYIFKKTSFFATMNSEDFFDEFIKEDFYSSYVPKEFERVCAQYLVRENKAQRIKPVLYKVGKYYYDDPINKTNGEFDIVTLSKDGYDFYEAKFSSNPIDDSVVNEEVFQLSRINIKYNKLGFFSKNGFNITKPEKYRLYTLIDLYK
ncbi:MAG: ATP-binding protein [Erysipelotrichaceae bacterium]|nr:ATP-binding protein [Erysipelotrichaceae bacterium]